MALVKFRLLDLQAAEGELLIMISAFITHREKVLGHYSTAVWLRQLVLAMWNGTDHQVGLSKIATIDADHFSAALAMIQAYRESGEHDSAFVALARECQQRVEAEKASALRADRYEKWRDAAQVAIEMTGGRELFVSDHDSWFERQFDAGMEPAAAVALALATQLDAVLAVR